MQAIYDCLGDGPRTLVDVGAWDGVHLSNTHSLLVPDASPRRGFLIEADASKSEKLRALPEPARSAPILRAVAARLDDENSVVRQRACAPRPRAGRTRPGPQRDP